MAAVYGVVRNSPKVRFLTVEKEEPRGALKNIVENRFQLLEKISINYRNSELAYFRKDRRAFLPTPMGLNHVIKSMLWGMFWLTTDTRPTCSNRSKALGTVTIRSIRNF